MKNLNYSLHQEIFQVIIVAFTVTICVCTDAPQWPQYYILILTNEINISLPKIASFNVQQRTSGSMPQISCLF